MTKQPRSTRKVETEAAKWWRNAWESHEGRAAIGALFVEFGIFATPQGTNDLGTLARSIGQRDVLARMSQLIGLRPDQSPAIDRDTADIVDRMMRQ